MSTFDVISIGDLGQNFMVINNYNKWNDINQTKQKKEKLEIVGPDSL